MKHSAPAQHRSVLRSVITIIAELLLTFAALCGVYLLWMEWWTGVQSEHNQIESRQSVAWVEPDNGEKITIAQPQQSDPIVQPEHATTGELIARVYIPQFGKQWERNLVQGTSLVELNKHGLGHYVHSQMPGAVGNFAIAGHRNGYGQPLGDIDKLKEGDPIIIRTKDYWYVYQYTNHTIVLPDDGSVIEANPEHPGEPATQRMITLTTCEPKYSTPTHRWVAFGTFKYWAKVADGIPQELAHTDSSGNTQFVSNESSSSFARHVGSLKPYIQWALMLYVIIFIAAALVFRWPLRHAIKEGTHKRPDASIYGGILRLQPGPAIVRWVLFLILIAAAVMALLEWGMPWLAQHIPALRAMSNYVTVP